MNNLVNVLNDLNNLKAKAGDLDVDKLKTAPVNLKKLNDEVSKEVVKNTKFNELNTRVNNIENESPGASTLIQTNQYNTDK